MGLSWVELDCLREEKYFRFGLVSFGFGLAIVVFSFVFLFRTAFLVIHSGQVIRYSIRLLNTNYNNNKNQKNEKLKTRTKNESKRKFSPSK